MRAVTLAPLDETRLEAALRLSRAVGWPHRREDWALNLSLGRGVVALQADEVVGVVVASFFGAGHATINLVIVAESQRGAGLGRRLMQQALAFCGDREVRLVATSEGLPLYLKLGFVGTGRIAQHQAVVAVEAAAEGVAWAPASDMPAILDLDRRATGVDRAALVEQLPRLGGLATARRGGAVVGYGAVRDFGRGAVIGPVAARDASTARALIRFLLASRSGQFLRVDVSRPEEFSPWLESLGLAKVGDGLSMRRPRAGAGEDRLSPSETGVRTYALASQALG